ncbi:TonB-dependent receptor [Sphingomonas sp. H160509]|uniref:TonB-dependent receptor n=1 Tax=Sphingomonas sp. H160509 TaxID=2955313 RepID=UPI003158645C
MFDTAGLEHTLVLGASLSQEDYTIVTGNTLRTADGTTVAQQPINLANPNTDYTGAFNFIESGRSQGTTSNAAVYAFDTIKIIPQIEANFGLRYEHAKGTFRADTFSTAVTIPATLGTYTRGLNQTSDETLFSYRGGINFKPIETVSLYASYGNSTTPTSATVRLGCGTLIGTPAIGGAGAGTVDPCDVQPEKAVNYEIGAKADLFGRKLQLTAALFRNERTNYRVATNDPIVTTLGVTDGRSRVDGIALGASGSVSKAWSIFANYTYLDGKVLQSVSNFCLDNPGTRSTTVTTPTTITTTITNPCGNSAAVLDPQKDQQLTNTPKHSGSLFTTYTLPFGLQLGYGLTYQGAFALNNSALATPTRADDRGDSRLPLGGLPDASRVPVVHRRQRPDRAAQRAELHQREILHRHPQQWLGDAGRGALGAADPVLQPVRLGGDAGRLPVSPPHSRVKPC